MSVVHGYSAYSRGSCRRPVCTAAWANYQREWKSRTGALSLMDARHGQPSTYNNYGCRCGPCRVAWAAYMKARRARRQVTS